MNEISTKIRNFKRNIVNYLIEYLNKGYDRKGLKLIDTSFANDIKPIYFFELQLCENFIVELIVCQARGTLCIKWGKINAIEICDNKPLDIVNNNHIRLITDVHDRLSDILYNYDNNQNIKSKNELIPKVIKIYELLNDKKHYVNEYVLFEFEDNDFIMTTKFSSEKNIKLLIKDNKIYYTFHGTYVEYDKWTPTALYKITKIIDNLLSNIKEIENDYLIKPICNPEEKSDENILLLI